MANKGGGIARQIIGSFEDIGEQVVKNVVKAPQDIVGKALESVGASTGGTKQSGGRTKTAGQAGDGWNTYDQAGDLKNRQAVAREALAALTRRKQQKEPDAFERQKMEAEQKQETRKQQDMLERKKLPKLTFRKKRGNLYGAKDKQTQTEVKGKGAD